MTTAHQLIDQAHHLLNTLDLTQADQVQELHRLARALDHTSKAAWWLRRGCGHQDPRFREHATDHMHQALEALDG